MMRYTMVLFFICCYTFMTTAVHADDKELIYAALEKIIILEKTVKRLENKITELEKKIDKIERPKKENSISSDVEREIQKIKDRLANKDETDEQPSIKLPNKTGKSDIIGFNFIGKKTYSCEEKTNTVKEYVHEDTGIEFVLVPGGTFKMGSSYGQESEKPIHKVTIDSFLISKYEITQLIWQKIMQGNPSYFKDKHKPIERISWSDAQKFCEKNNLRLPTEAEWEYAYRAGTTSSYYWGTQDANEYAWFWDNSSRTTHRVGLKKPNAFGLFDMSGNVMEWCSDIYEEYTSADVVNPKGAEKGFDRIMRGGSWYSDVKECRSAYRMHKPARHFKFNVGFRVCKSLK
ncbi:SUMF1/EgtB/PvdO family nonheme iron enzyme [Candidatus Uabimicrobium sp. HlEnr_7]|uniref:SUMF1/EgtB/PvdO family nonheme iron enzyme n=1 Tax=Candidatus Uabimicrobium helgolandensis TaxID=3095367 RepID=UPI0035563961